MLGGNEHRPTGDAIRKLREARNEESLLMC